MCVAVSLAFSSSLEWIQLKINKYNNLLNTVILKRVWRPIQKKCNDDI